MSDICPEHRNHAVMEKEREMTKEEIEKIKEEICDKFCKYPEQISDDDLLMVMCNKCPLDRLKEEE